MKHLFILNRFAGTHDATQEIEQKIRALKTDDEVLVEYTGCKGDAVEIARRYAKQGGPLRVYSCGGDGTANEALTGLFGFENVALGVVPIGSGNDFVRSFPYETDEFLDIRRMIDGELKRIDLLRCNERLALNVISVGYDCEVADRAQQIKRRPGMNGSMAYKLAIAECLLTKRKHTFTPYADGKRIKLKPGYKTQMLAVAANGKYYGGGIMATPRALVDDGNIDFMSIPTISVPRFAALVSTFIKGEHIDNPKMPFILHQKCKELKIDNGGDIKVGIDGEMFIMTDPVITVLPSAFDVILPKSLKKESI